MSDFDDVGKFHKKFNLTVSNGVASEITPDLRDFRLQFLLEELAEIAEGYGLELKYELKPIDISPAPCTRCGYNGEGYYQPDTHKCVARYQDLPKIADGLVDLVYVALGTAHLHNLPWEKLFAEVQRANMTKERCEVNHPYREKIGQQACCDQPKHKHSLRGNINDVIKPPGWKAPAIIEVLMRAGWKGPALPLETS